MILYLAIIGVAMLVIAGSVALACGQGFFYVLGLTALAVVVVMVIDGVTAAVCRALPAKCANVEGRIFQVSAKEKKFYEKLKIRKWKDYVPEIGHLTGFRKNKIADPKSVAYLDRFLLECSYGQIGHFVSLWTGYLLLLLFPISELWLPIAIPVATVSLLMNLPSLFILRYNSYKLRILRSSTLKKQSRATEEAIA